MDYFTRLFLAKNKWKFVKGNIPDLLSIIPFNQIFQAIRVFRIFRLTRLVQLTKFARIAKIARLLSVLAKFTKLSSDFVKTNHFAYIAYFTGCAILFGAVGISYAEDLNFGDGLWWSVVTTATVGYGDISPKTVLGRIIAAALMFIGIGFLGMFTGTISTYFITRVKKANEAKEDQQFKKQAMISLDGLSEQDMENAISYVEYLKNKKR